MRNIKPKVDMLRTRLSMFIGMLILVISSLHATDFKTIQQEISDSFITAKIKAKFTENTNLNPLKISVSTNHKIVSLSGYVGNRKAFVDALRIAKNTQGVESVRASKLYIKEVNSALTDAFITAKAETSILKAKVLDDESIPLVGIQATTANGVVTLSGQVKNQSSIQFIVKRIKSIHGVKKVIVNLQIKAIG